MGLFSRPGLIRNATAILCVLLMANLCTLTPGCGWESGLIPAQDVVVILLSPGDAISESLKDTAFNGAQALVIDRANGSFQLVFPDENRTLNGQFVRVGESWEMTNLYFESNGQAGEMTLDPNTRQVTAIKTAEGATWRPSKPATPSARLQAENRFESYLASNPELVSMTHHDPKKSDAEFGFIPIAFFTIMIIWMLCADPVLIVCPGILPIFAFIAAVLGVLPTGNTGPAQLPAPGNPPDARDDAFTTNINTPVVSEVLTDHGSGADSDADGDALSTTLVTNPTGGNVALQSNGNFTYTPSPGFVGTDTFVYQLSDGKGGTDNATVTITVINRPPVARNDTFTYFADRTTLGNLFIDNGFGIDSDPDGDPITVIAVNGSAANVGVFVFLADGTVTVQGNGNFVFFDSGFPGVNTFTYTISDGRGGTSTATVTINVIAVP